jgi:hypothetical protein
LNFKLRVLLFVCLMCSAGCSSTTKQSISKERELTYSLGIADWEFQGSIGQLADTSDTVAIIEVESVPKEWYLDGGGDTKDPNSCCWAAIFRIKVVEQLKGAPVPTASQFLSIFDFRREAIAGQRFLAFLLTKKAETWSNVSGLDYDFFVFTGDPGFTALNEVSPGQFGLSSGRFLRLGRADQQTAATFGLADIRRVVDASKPLRPMEYKDFGTGTGTAPPVRSRPENRSFTPPSTSGQIPIFD